MDLAEKGLRALSMKSGDQDQHRGGKNRMNSRRLSAETGCLCYRV